MRIDHVFGVAIAVVLAGAACNRADDVAKTPQLIAKLSGHASDIAMVGVLPDSKTVASASRDDGVIKLWDLANQKERASLEPRLGKCYGFSIAPDGKTLAASYFHYTEKGDVDGGGVVFWDTVAGREIRRLPYDRARVINWLVFAPDGQTAAIVDNVKKEAKDNYRLTLVDAISMEARKTLSAAWTWGAVFSPDGKTLSAITMDAKNKRDFATTIRRWNTATGVEMPVLANPANGKTTNILHLAYSPDGTTLAGADSGGTVIFWDNSTGASRVIPAQVPRTRTHILAYAPDGKTLALGLEAQNIGFAKPGKIVLFDVMTGRTRAVLTGHKSDVSSIAFSPDGKFLVSNADDRIVYVWDLSR